MEDVLLNEAIERYINGEMTNEELAHFERFRQANAEIDQMIVEHRYFNKLINQYGDRKILKSQADSIHVELMASNEIAVTAPKPQEAKVVGLYNRFKKQIAVAATVAGLISLVTLSIMFAFKQQVNEDYRNLNNKIEKASKKADKVSSVPDTRSVSYRSASSSGTGFVIAANYLITNMHVVENNSEVVVYNEKFGELKAEVVKTDATHDLALLKIVTTNEKLNALRLPYSIIKTNAGIGHEVFSLGYGREESIMYNQGYVSSVDGYKEYKNKGRFLLTLNAEGGNSGSPIFNNRGEIVGVISQKEVITNGYLVGIKSSSLRSFIADCKVEGKSLLNSTANTRGLSQEAKNKKIQDCIFMIRK